MQQIVIEVKGRREKKGRGEEKKEMGKTEGKKKDGEDVGAGFSWR